MSRTTRLCKPYIIYYNYHNLGDPDPRDASQNGRDGSKYKSALYDDYIKQPGWSRDHYTGIGQRQWKKKCARRHRRREDLQIVCKETLEYFHDDEFSVDEPSSL
ncbi:hypothetical protein EVB94_036 [Rhizobium phage RHph_TM40]|nr:hypothetical protein EVB94_036 [Rhizobium phage RHph_TM40]QIG72232.1 hypothetical protein EVB96_036 [Rhizobium phage RHph_TM3_3_6]